MIKIASNKSFERLKLNLFEIYESYDINITNLIKNIYKTEFYFKQLTPLIQNYGNIIDEQYMVDFKKSISFIGECYYVVSKNSNKVDTRSWNKDEIVYDISEFGSKMQQKKSKFVTQKDIVIKSFSKSCFRFMCIKSEILIYVLFSIASKMNNQEDVYINDLQPFIGGINYALTKSQETNNTKNIISKINSMARYVWELSTVFNTFVSQNKQISKCLPSHNVFDYDRSLIHEDIFGICWDTTMTEQSTRLFSQCVSNDNGVMIPITQNKQLFNLQIDDQEFIDIIDEYTENYKNLIQTIIVLFKSSTLLITKLISSLAHLTKSELNHIVIDGSIVIY